MNSPVGKAILARVRGGDYAHPGEEAAVVEAAALVSCAGVRRVLDIGCGRGGTAAWFQRQGWGEVVGIDIDAESVAYARSRYPDVVFFAADVAGLDRLALPPFDLVYLLTAYYAFPDQAAALRQMTHACRPGGRLLLVDYTRPDASSPPSELGTEIGRPPTLAELTEGLTASGWSAIHAVDWTPRFVEWYAQLLERLHSRRTEIVAGWGADWYDYVTRWYGLLYEALRAQRLGGVALTATRGAES